MDESQPFDVTIFDAVVSASYDPRHPERSMANEILMKLREQSNAWAKADAIIENSTLPQGRFFGLMALDDAINTRGAGVRRRLEAVGRGAGRDGGRGAAAFRKGPDEEGRRGARVRRRWKILPEEQRVGIKGFIVNKVIQSAAPRPLNF